MTRSCGAAAVGFVVALSAAGAQGPPKPLVFTRPTIVAVVVDPQFVHRLIFEDDRYRFLERHYGSGGKYTPGFFVHRKADDTWLQILELRQEDLAAAFDGKRTPVAKRPDPGNVNGAQVARLGGPSGRRSAGGARGAARRCERSRRRAPGAGAPRRTCPRHQPVRNPSKSHDRNTCTS